MTNTIKHWNDPKNATTLSGDPVRREEKLFIPSHKQWYPVLQTSMHFVYRDPTVKRGSTLLCTCGSAAGIFGYHAYKRWSSFIENEVISCHNFIQYGVHADGSHE